MDLWLVEGDINPGDDDRLIYEEPHPEGVRVTRDDVWRLIQEALEEHGITEEYHDYVYNRLDSWFDREDRSTPFYLDATIYTAALRSASGGIY